MGDHPWWRKRTNASTATVHQQTLVLVLASVGALLVAACLSHDAKHGLCRELPIVLMLAPSGWAIVRIAMLTMDAFSTVALVFGIELSGAVVSRLAPRRVVAFVVSVAMPTGDTIHVAQN